MKVSKKTKNAIINGYLKGYINALLELKNVMLANSNKNIILKNPRLNSLEDTPEILDYINNMINKAENVEVKDGFGYYKHSKGTYCIDI
jgi:hypothetical protein